MSQLKKGALLSYVTIFLTTIIGLVLTPFIIRSLGDAEYGLYILIGAFVGYMTVMDFGLNDSIVRFVSKYRAEGDKKGEENFLAVTMIIYGFISLIVALLGVGLYFNLDSIFGDSLTATELSKAKVMFIILIFNMVITLPGGAFTAICNAYESFVYPRLLNIGRYLFRTAAVVGLLLLEGDAIGLVIVDTLMNLLVILFTMYFAFKKLKVTFALYRFELQMVKEIFSYSAWIFVIAIVYNLQWKGGQVLLGIKTDTVTVAIYAVGILLGTYYGAFASAINGVFLPRAMQMIVNNENPKVLTDMTIKIGRIVLLCLLLILGGFILFGRDFVFLWVGEQYYNAWLIALIIMLSSTNILVQAFFDSILKAKNLFKFKGYIYIIFISVGTILGFILIDRLDSLGMIIGICLGWLISQFLLNFYYRYKLKLEIKRFYIELTDKLMFVFFITLFIGFLINLLFSNVSWFYFLIKVSIYVIVYSFLMYKWAINNFEMETIKNTLKVKHFNK